MRNFESLHPIVLFIYFISIMFISMITKHPIVLLLSFSGSLLFSSMLEKPRMFFINLAFYIPLFLLIAITNPLFSHNGETILFFLNDQRVTLEAILYGMAIGGMIITILYWSKCYVHIMSTDKFLYLFGTVTPRIAIVISMAIRFIPLFKQKIKRVNQAQKTLGLYTSRSFTDRIKSSLRVFSSVVTWGFENSINTADSMKARGYGFKNRTNYSLFRFRIRDAIILISLIVVDIVIIIYYCLGSLEFYYYPVISKVVFNGGIFIVVATISYLVYLPFVSEVKENIKWRYLKSMI